MRFEGCLGCGVGLGALLFEFIWLFSDLLGVGSVVL